MLNLLTSEELISTSNLSYGSEAQQAIVELADTRLPHSLPVTESAPPTSGTLARAAARVATRVGVVNGLRGIAIIAVIYHHLMQPYVSPGGFWERKFQMLGRYAVSSSALIENAWMGVNLFFILSGFVLMLPYAAGARGMQSRGEVADFLVRRAKRLLPLFYLVLVLGLFIETRTSSWVHLGGLMPILRMATFTFIFYEPHFLPFWDVPLWSLAIEVYFSLLFPLLLLVERRMGIVKLLLVTFALALAVRLFATVHHTGRATHLHWLKDSPLARLDDFVLGMALCRMYVARRVPRGLLSVASAVAGVALVFVSAVIWDNVLMHIVRFELAAGLNILTSAGFGLLLLGLLNAPELLRKLFALPPLQLCGMMCYSLYIWHMFGIDLNGPKWGAAAQNQLWALFLVVAISAFTYRYIEFPTTAARKLFLEYPK